MTASDTDPEKGSTQAPDESTSDMRTASVDRGRRHSAESLARTLSQVRSQNGYGVADEDDGDKAKPEAGTGGDDDERDPYEVGWDGGDSDPLCPRSFTPGRKWLITLIAAFASFCVTAASSMFTATYTQMEAEFGESRIVSTLGLSTFVLGIALGPMLFGPLSEFYGRRPIYLVAWTLYVIWFVPQAVAPNVQTVIVCRFLNGFAGSTFLAVSGGTVGDLFARHELQAPMVLFSIAPFIGPCVGPLVSGFVNYNVSWRWTYYVLIIWSSALLAAIVFLLPETFHPILLRDKARALRRDTGDDRWWAPAERAHRSVLGAVGNSLLRPFQLLIYEPMCLLLCLLSALLLGILYLFFGAFALVFSTNHGFNLWQIGLTFTGMSAGLLLAAACDPVWTRLRVRLVAKLERETGVQGASEPELRLPPVIAGAVLVPVGLFWFGWTTYPSIHWIVPIIGSGVFAMGTLLCFSGIFTFLVDAYPHYAASALAANAFVRCTFAAAFPLFGTQMYEKLGYQWASSLLAFLTLAMAPFPYIFFLYGKRIRSKSRFAKK
ncbi:Fungal trichothecene efflux pump (TRI12) [Geosmithia morbida]|uniref:Fungal trichothecene efflux pump (TRI12) n=1 Tax=Geosmithia morbida TaxID=1094350 RepID=A0A9P5D6G4_9HYPO|nr:Fungal trichothecene efflux pump (TRI12) [Geosmithia morbida]KAF4125581.1 Fungal trichothecene efflux pump (TRI12) [Geosmithia morbida]